MYKNSIKLFGDIPKTCALKKRTLKKASNPFLAG